MIFFNPLQSRDSSSGSKQMSSSSSSFQMGQLVADKHVRYILMSEKKKESFESVVMDHLRINGAYWGLTTLDLLDKLGSVSVDEVVSWLMTCQHESGLSLLEYPGVKAIDPAYALPVDAKSSSAIVPSEQSPSALVTTPSMLLEQEKNLGSTGDLDSNPATLETHEEEAEMDTEHAYENYVSESEGNLMLKEGRGCLMIDCEWRRVNEGRGCLMIDCEWSSSK
ncbi:hypothetical protein DY000_02019178 [Brassica cretica]|uniref:Prenyltransferase alpha-alpha toroid domain-containing protein n=1 Tax=Brassica cretica TaxID=69181 RepID=A0ABQ7D981_BRACR|nr:hypothetical protein DY000_02019178 [Brassica cretica]